MVKTKRTWTIWKNNNSKKMFLYNDATIELFLFLWDFKEIARRRILSSYTRKVAYYTFTLKKHF